MNKEIKVVCAVINFNDKILVVQRSEKMSLPLKWEFPGGKIEEGETDDQSIKREIKEELNIEIEVVKKLTPTFFDYPSVSIELIPFLANYITGKLELKEHKNYKLLNINELIGLDWAEADLPIVKELQQL
jgi:8-oxo-dGTP diphosphatase